MNGFLRIQEIELRNSERSYILDSINIKYITMYNSIDQLGYILKIDYNDITDVKNKFPLKSGESLRLTLIDYFNNEFQKEFVLSKVQEISNIDEQNRFIQLSFISKESYYLSINRAYDSFIDTPLNICRRYIPSLTSLNTPTKMLNIISPGFTYSKLIKYLQTFTYDFVYERNTDYVYTDVDSLVQQEPIRDYDFYSTNSFSRTLIIDYQEIKVFDAVKEGYENDYKRNNIYFNPNTKTFEQQNHTINTVQDSTFTLGSGANFSTEIQDNINTINTHKIFYEDGLSITSITNLFNKKYELLLYGDVSLQVGDVMNIRYKERFNDNPNPLLNGRYVISKLAHHIDGKNFYTKVQVSKNAYFKGDMVDNVVV